MMSESHSLWSFNSFINRLSEVSGILAGISILVSALVLTYEVLMRYIFNTPTIWEIEFSVNLLIMATFVGAAYGLKHGKHIGINIIMDHLPPQMKARISFVTSILSLIFCILVLGMGVSMWWEAASLGWRSDTLWGPPLWIPYAFIPLGMTFLCLQYVVHLSDLWADLKSEKVEKPFIAENRRVS